MLLHKGMSRPYAHCSNCVLFVLPCLAVAAVLSRRSCRGVGVAAGVSVGLDVTTSYVEVSVSVLASLVRQSTSIGAVLEVAQ